MSPLQLAPHDQRSARPLLTVRPSKEFYHWLLVSHNEAQRFAATRRAGLLPQNYARAPNV